MKNLKNFYNHEIREKIWRELVRYGKIIIDIQYEKYYHYFRKMVIKYNNFVYEVVMENGDCLIIKNLLT